MSQLNTPLSDQEIDELNRFLLERIPEEEANAAVEGVDEGVLDISELDGFLTAIVSGPQPLKPSEWLPVLWGEYEPAWGSNAEAEATISLVLRHMNAIVNTLVEAPEEFEPIVLEVEEEEATITSVEEWCLGYMKGVSLAMSAWQQGGQEVMDLLFPVMVFTTEEGRSSLARLDAQELDTLKRSLPTTVRKLYAFWQRRRALASVPFSHSEPQVGRNDPCPCGSGKKFKKCCLH
ncbi:MAG: UPF0149 family protein [Gammaproteobacteria bacterium]|nr:UPF0149 family protein [Gammaproteobacteria bacterium]MCW8973847.1 UPF0149 family protein [Gammaproteobacteria bacterium]MCW8992751.1 UPF0149 family protein [Gammaproteobacteria bacterium]